MPVDVQGIAETSANAYESKMLEARQCDTIDEALDKQKEGFKEALEIMMTMFMAQAIVAGGNCPPNAPLVGAKIT